MSRLGGLAAIGVGLFLASLSGAMLVMVLTGPVIMVVAAILLCLALGLMCGFGLLLVVAGTAETCRGGA